MNDETKKKERERKIIRNLSICVGREKILELSIHVPVLQFSRLIISLSRFIDKLNRRKDDGLLNLRSGKKKKKKENGMKHDHLMDDKL